MYSISTHKYICPDHDVVVKEWLLPAHTIHAISLNINVFFPVLPRTSIFYWNNWCNFSFHKKFFNNFIIFKNYANVCSINKSIKSFDFIITMEIMVFKRKLIFPFTDRQHKKKKNACICLDKYWSCIIPSVPYTFEHI